MRNWIACSTCLILFLNLSVLCFCIPKDSHSQIKTSVKKEYQFSSPDYSPYNGLATAVGKVDTLDTASMDSLPDPKSVMYQSMMIPGWGQVTNNQIWKVPIIYGILGGLAWYSVDLTKKYHDYRAAYYNLNPDNPSDDLRFGETPDYIPEDANLEQIRTIRNRFRNRRDLVYVGFVLAYGLNIVDAYVFAHMRSFDVSEDLSMRARIQPAITSQAVPGVSLSIDLIKK